MNFPNTRKQGDAGVAATMAYCAWLGRMVALPIGEGQRYDLVVEAEDGTLLRVQCKTAFTTTRNGSFQAELRTKGGNKSGDGRQSRISAAEVDVVAILDGKRRLWWIPAVELEGRRSITFHPTKAGEHLCYDPATP